MKILIMDKNEKERYIVDANHITVTSNGTIVITHLDDRQTDIKKSEYEYFGVGP